VAVLFAWDPKKATTNLRTHKVSFDEAMTVFLDPFARTFDDPDHSLSERRSITIGTSNRHRVLFVSHADGPHDWVRVISARTATAAERYAYQELED
jgi:uncharacterized DUF497 family protein